MTRAKQFIRSFKRRRIPILERRSTYLGKCGLNNAFRVGGVRLKHVLASLIGTGTMLQGHDTIRGETDSEALAAIVRGAAKLP